MENFNYSLVIYAILYFVFYLVNTDEKKEQELNRKTKRPTEISKKKMKESHFLENAWYTGQSKINHYKNSINEEVDFYKEHPVTCMFSTSFCEQITYYNKSTFLIFLN